MGLAREDELDAALPQQGGQAVPLSPAVKAGDFVFVSGQTPRDPKTGEFVVGDIQAQTRQVLENVKAVLEAAGSSMEKVVKDPRMNPETNPMPFDGKRMIYGGFKVLVDL